MLQLTLIPPASLPEPNADLASLPGLKEILLGHQALAATGHLNDTQLISSALGARRLGLRTVLNWDLLVSDNQIAMGGSLIRRLNPDHFDAFRARDPGAAHYLRSNWPDKPLQLILESGNHNLSGIQTWIEKLQPQRVILSNEIPLETIARMRPHLQAEVEILAMGRLLIFYTPRKLLSPISPDQEEFDSIQRFMVSEEDRKRFPFLENQHGTFMYYEKDLFLIPFLEEIETACVDFVRLDLRFYDHQTLLQPLNQFLTSGDHKALEAIKSCLPSKLTRGFYKSNRTDKQLKKLVNPHLRKKADETYIGDVVETRKKQYIAMETRTPFRVGDTLLFVIPEGDHIPMEVRWISDALGTRTEIADQPGLWLVNHVPKISSGSKIYLG